MANNTHKKVEFQREIVHHKRIKGAQTNGIAALEMNGLAFVSDSPILTHSTSLRFADNCFACNLRAWTGEMSGLSRKKCDWESEIEVVVMVMVADCTLFLIKSCTCSFDLSYSSRISFASFLFNRCSILRAA